MGRGKVCHFLLNWNLNQKRQFIAMFRVPLSGKPADKEWNERNRPVVYFCGACPFGTPRQQG